VSALRESVITVTQIQDGRVRIYTIYRNALLKVDVYRGRARSRKTSTALAFYDPSKL